MDPQPPTLMSQVRNAIRVRHYSIRTEQAYVMWIRHFIHFHGTRHPRELGASEIASFLSYLAVERRVAPATQNQAMNALVFLYRKVLQQPLEEIAGVVRATQRQKLPVVLTLEEVRRLLSELRGLHWLIACLQYGSGLRLLESVRLRVKDLDFPHRAIYVRDGKGRKDRVVTLPDELIPPLKAHLQERAALFDEDVRAGVGSVFLPYARPASLSRRAAIPCGTPSQRICSSVARIFAPCRSSSAMRMCAPPRSTPTSCSEGGGRCAVRCRKCFSRLFLATAGRGRRQQDSPSRRPAPCRDRWSPCTAQAWPAPGCPVPTVGCAGCRAG